jgi:PAS domain S-box-containing protein
MSQRHDRDPSLDRLRVAAVLLPLAYIAAVVAIAEMLDLPLWATALVALAISAPPVLVFTGLAFRIFGRAQAEIRGREERFRALLESAPDGILIADTSGRIVMVNEQVQRMLGYSADSLIGERVEMLLPDSLRDTHVRHRDAFHAKPGVRPMGVGLDLVARAKDGTLVPVEISLSPIKQGDETLVTAVIRDVTERRKAEEALRLSEERFRLLVTGVRDYAIFMLDRDGRVASWNTGAQRISGYTADEIIGKSHHTFYPEDDVTAGKPDHEMRLAATSGRAEVEGWRVRRDGTRFLASVVTTALRTDEGAAPGFAQLMRDITERRRLEEERERLLGERETERERQRIAMDLHDGIIQQIYGTALGLELAEEEAGDGAAREHIERAIASLNDVIRDIRSYIFDLRPASYDGDLTESLSSLVDEFRRSSLVQTTAEIGDELPPVGHDEAMAVLQVAREALNNARKHARASAVCLRAHAANGQVRLEVSDNGGGFDPHADMTAEHRGLRNMRSRASLVGGELAITSASGAGTTVVLDVPIRTK